MLIVIVCCWLLLSSYAWLVTTFCLPFNTSTIIVPRLLSSYVNVFSVDLNFLLVKGSKHQRQRQSSVSQAILQCDTGVHHGSV